MILCPCMYICVRQRLINLLIIVSQVKITFYNKNVQFKTRNNVYNNFLAKLLDAGTKIKC